MVKQNASLDASFWINAYEGDLIQFLPEYFSLFAPQIVAEEIRYPLDVLGIEASGSILFDTWCRSGKVTLQNPESPVDWFQRGENAAIALAIEQRYFLLIDDANPYHRAKAASLKVIGTADLTIFLYDKTHLSFKTALSVIKHARFSKKQKQDALIALEILRRRKGD